MTDLVYVDRQTWGSLASTETFIDRRTKVPAADKTTVQVHNTAAIDGNDTTPNRWDYDEAVTYVKSLQWARPELGPLPYCDMFAVSEDLSTVWVFEGRGALTLGAHTAGHNWDGYGVALMGNFDKDDAEAVRVLLWALHKHLWSLLRSGLLPNLGTIKSPNGWDCWGHRDSSPKSCPGNHVYPLLPAITFTKGPPAMAQETYGQAIESHSVTKLPGSWATTAWNNYVAAGGSSKPESGVWPAFRFDIAWFWNKFVRPLTGRLDKLDKNVSDLDATLDVAIQRIHALESATPQPVDTTAIVRDVVDEIVSRLNS